MLRSVGRAELLNGHRVLAVVKVVVGDELAATIGTQALEVKSERHDIVLHELDQSRQRLAHQDEVGHLKFGVVIGVLCHDAVAPRAAGVTAPTRSVLRN